MQDITKDLTNAQRDLLEWLYTRKKGGMDAYRDGARAITDVQLQVRQQTPLAHQPVTVLSFTLRQHPRKCSGECGQMIGHRQLTIEVSWSWRGRQIQVVQGGATYLLTQTRLKGDAWRSPRLTVARLQRIVEAWLAGEITL